MSFYGVRGSTPCSSDRLRRYGGNTSCVVLEADGQAPIIFDMGTGLREYGMVVGARDNFSATILVTHLHWDHVQGLPFFGPLHAPDAQIDVYGPPHDQQELDKVFAGLMKPPYFPISCDELNGGVTLNTLWNQSIAIGDLTVTTREVPHTGETNGYRVDAGAISVAYVSDHAQPLGTPDTVADSVLELCDGVDLLIHDAQFTEAEFAERPHWGHCTPFYALEVARQAGAKRLALFHHDPFHDDDQVDGLLEACRQAAADDGIEVVAAFEGLCLSFDGPAT